MAGAPSECLVRSPWCGQGDSKRGSPRAQGRGRPRGVSRSLEGGIVRLRSPQREQGGGLIRLSLHLCGLESCFWDTLALLAVLSLCCRHDNWFHASGSLNSRIQVQGVITAHCISCSPSREVEAGTACS